MPSDLVWLSPDHVIELNQHAVALTGEPHLVLARGQLESALGRPLAYWSYEGVENPVTLAMKLLFGIAASHPFMQGNKRTGFAAAALFLSVNGLDFDAPDDGALFAELMLDVIEHRMDEDTFEAIYGAHVRIV